LIDPRAVLIEIGRNTAATITPAIAVNMVF